MNTNKEIIISNRLNNNLLINKSISISYILKKLLGIQAQYSNYALFNIFSRLEKNSDNLENLFDSSIIGWGQRQTVHYYDLNNWQEINILLNSEERWPKKYLKDYGVDLESNISKLKYFLTKNNGSTREEIKKVYGDEWAILSNWAALFLEASCRGNLFSVKKNIFSKEQNFFWKDNYTFKKNENIKIDMLEKYLIAYGPASKKDIAHFFGVNQSFFDIDFSKYFNKITESKIDLFYTDINTNQIIPEILVLGKFDPLLVAYAHKQIMFDDYDNKLIWKKGGQISSVILYYGNLIGIWEYKIYKNKINFFVFLKFLISKEQKLKIESNFYEFSLLLNKTFNGIIYKII